MATVDSKDGVCPDCGNPIRRSWALVNMGGRKGCVRVELPGYCNDRRCREDRDEAAIANLIARGVIDK